MGETTTARLEKGKTELQSERLLTPRQVAQILQVSVGTLQGWRNRKGRRGHGPDFLALGNPKKPLIRYSRRAVKLYLTKRLVRAEIERMLRLQWPWNVNRALRKKQVSGSRQVVVPKSGGALNDKVVTLAAPGR